MKYPLLLLTVIPTIAFSAPFKDLVVAKEKTSYQPCVIKYTTGDRKRSLNVSKIESIEVYEHRNSWVMELITVSGGKYHIPLKDNLSDEELTDTRDRMTDLMGSCH